MYRFATFIADVLLFAHIGQSIKLETNTKEQIQSLIQSDSSVELTLGASTSLTHQHTCDYAHKRIWNGSIDFNKILEETDPATYTFVDQGFPLDDVLVWEDARRNKSSQLSKEKLKLAHFERQGDAFTDSYTMWGKALDSEDMRQGRLGNCWFITGAATVASKPQLIHNIFLTEQRNPQGIYSTRLYALGVPVTVTVDDRIPLVGNKMETIFAKIDSEERSLWGSILEKAMAKLHGNYENLNGGSAGYAIQTMTGAPYAYHQLNGKTREEVKELLEQAQNSGALITMGTKGHDDTKKDDNGIVKGHAYSVIGIYHPKSVDQVLVKVRNPWAVEGYKGPFSDSDPVWINNPALKQELNHISANDGYFFMDFESFYTSVGSVQVNQDVSNKQLSYFLVKDDANLANSTSKPGFTEHTFKIVSPVNQTVSVSLNLWKDVMYPNKPECSAGRKNRHYFKDVEARFTVSFGNEFTFTSKELIANEPIEFITYLNWADSGITRDFSLTVWGDQQVQITDKSGQLTSTTFGEHAGEDAALFGGSPSDYQFDRTQDAARYDIASKQEYYGSIFRQREQERLQKEEAALGKWFNSLEPRRGGCQILTNWKTLYGGMIGYATRMMVTCGAFDLFYTYRIHESLLQDEQTIGNLTGQTEIDENGFKTFEFKINRDVSGGCAVRLSGNPDGSKFKGSYSFSSKF